MSIWDKIRFKRNPPGKIIQTYDQVHQLLDLTGRPEVIAIGHPGVENLDAGELEIGQFGISLMGTFVQMRMSDSTLRNVPVQQLLDQKPENPASGLYFAIANALRDEIRRRLSVYNNLDAEMITSEVIKTADAVAQKLLNDKQFQNGDAYRMEYKHLMGLVVARWKAEDTLGLMKRQGIHIT